MRWELTKLRAQRRARAVIELCVLAPFAFVAVLVAQPSVPGDTLFGRWVHESGTAVPLVALGFCGQWALPLLGSVVAGDVFSSEDHLGTWATLLTRSVGRREVFTGKVLAAGGFAVAVTVVLALASTAAGLATGHQPLVGLSGQLVGVGTALPLVLGSWATAVLPTVAFASLGVLASVWTRSSVAGIGVPVVVSLLMQVAALADGPAALQVPLLSTALVAWHGLWVQPSFTRPLWQGSVVALVWVAVCLSAAWAIFSRREVRVR